MQIQLVHCADLHIGAPFSYLPTGLAKIRRAELCNSFANIVSFCKEKSVDALLICGDLFDSPTPAKCDSEFVKSLLASLAPIPVYIVCGNHDYMNSESPYIKEGYFSDNVHIFPGFDFTFEIPEKNIALHGKSYTSSTVKPSFETLLTDGNKINIMCLHGDMTATSDYQIIKKETLDSLGCEYAAFGHIHNSEIFNTGKVKCAYSGTPEPHKFNDDGNTGFIYAKISKTETLIMPVDMACRHYQNIELDISGFTQFEIWDAIKKLCVNSDLYKISLIGERISDEPIDLPFLKKLISEYAFYAEITDNTKACYDLDSIESEESLRGEFLRELRKICSGEEDFILSAKAGLDALSGQIPSPEVYYAD